MRFGLAALALASSFSLALPALAEGPHSRAGERTFADKMEWLYDGMREDFRPEMEEKLGALFGGRATTSSPIVRDYGVLANLLRMAQSEYAANLTSEEDRRLDVLRVEFEAIARDAGWFGRFGEDALVQGMDARFGSLARTPGLRLLERRAEAWSGTNVARDLETRLERELTAPVGSAEGAGVARD